MRKKDIKDEKTDDKIKNIISLLTLIKINKDYYFFNMKYIPNLLNSSTQMHH